MDVLIEPGTDRCACLSAPNWRSSQGAETRHRPERPLATFCSVGLPAISDVSGAWLRSRYPDTRRERHRVSSSEVKAPPRALAM